MKSGRLSRPEIATGTQDGTVHDTPTDIATDARENVLALRARARRPDKHPTR
jgi:hypothetical protein